jgi:hypothetical protein
VKIILDIDGVLVTTPSWKKAELLDDGFLKFDKEATDNLNILLFVTNATIVLISTHRIKYSNDELSLLFKSRGINANIEKINDVDAIHLIDKPSEIINWVNTSNSEYLIIDDDSSLGVLPKDIKMRWIKPSPLIGFSEDYLCSALSIFNKQI